MLTLRQLSRLAYALVKLPCCRDRPHFQLRVRDSRDKPSNSFYGVNVPNCLNLFCILSLPNQTAALRLDCSFFFFFFSRVLRDSTTRFVGPSIGPSVGPSVGPSHFTFFLVFAVFGLTAPAQMIW